MEVLVLELKIAIKKTIT